METEYLSTVPRDWIYVHIYYFIFGCTQYPLDYRTFYYHRVTNTRGRTYDINCSRESRVVHEHHNKIQFKKGIYFLLWHVKNVLLTVLYNNIIFNVLYIAVCHRQRIKWYPWWSCYYDVYHMSLDAHRIQIFIYFYNRQYCFVTGSAFSSIIFDKSGRFRDPPLTKQRSFLIFLKRWTADRTNTHYRYSSLRYYKQHFNKFNILHTDIVSRDLIIIYIFNWGRYDIVVSSGRLV